ncbi:MAG: nitrate reductase cytochrome c-type subunit; periplasmic nitrate reductase electron transfer subunit [Gammaproteobacteria bacterium]|jgi:cytochrome c-type protein NapB|nr:nitrate reductase cytochrome c-type subunit; periplasmic nitrate reductase electron transfer subunit [Gammaproteobacteria bacterium]
MRKTIILAIVLSSGFAVTAQEQDYVATLRGPTPLHEQPSAPPTPKVVEEDTKRQRSYPEQPPTIPHSIRDYQVDLNVNKCLGCHARHRTGESAAPMVSITHFMDRDGQFRAAVSPRRYFCNQCHVVENRVKPLVENDFVDVHAILSK